MLKKMQHLFVMLAAAGLAMTPIAAQANTRAGDSGTFYAGSQSQPGLSRSAEGEDFISTSAFLVSLVLGAYLTGIVVIVADLDGRDDDNQSPGAN